MQRTAINAILAAALLLPACAAAHEGHPPAAASAQVSKTRYPWGVQGDPRAATRVIAIDMADTMRFSPDRIELEPGTTVKFVAKNSGRQMHEMVIGTESALREHAAMMKRHPGMVHDEPYMAHVKPGATEEITWTFVEPGTYMFGCLIPGHWEAGMKGSIVVAKKK